MGRRLLNLLTALSLLACVAATVMWVRSYCVSDQVEWVIEYMDVPRGQVWNTDTQFIRSSRGWWSQGDYRTRPDAMYEEKPESVKQRRFEWRRTKGPFPISLWATRFGGETPMPYWLTALGFAVLPAWRVTAQRVRRTLRRRRQNRIGLCASCGYDLRATLGRCPECGTTAAVASGS